MGAHAWGINHPAAKSLLRKGESWAVPLTDKMDQSAPFHERSA
jgi:hypothetical protein